MRLSEEEKKKNVILKIDYNKRLAGPQVARANLGGPDLQSHDSENYYIRCLRFVPKPEVDNTLEFNSCFIMHTLQLYKKLNILHGHKVVNNFFIRKLATSFHNKSPRGLNADVFF